MLQLELTIRLDDIMIDELRALAIFATVIEKGSFRAAARSLKLSPSVVSHHISQLEERLGVALIYRSTRRLSLTHEGKQLFKNAKTMILAAETGLNQITHQSDMPSGQLKITIPAILVRSPLVKAIAAFAKKFSRVNLFIQVSDAPQDIIREGIDLAIRIGNLTDSSLKAKKLFNLTRTLVASPEILQHHKKPRHPQDLTTWNWIGFNLRPNNKKFIHHTGKTAVIKFEPHIVADSVDAVCQLALEDLGLATPPSFLVTEALQKGHLVEILPTWEVEPLPVYALWPSNVTQESLTYKLIKFLEK